MRAPLPLVFAVLAGVSATDVSAQTRGGARMSGPSAQPPARPLAPPSNLLPPLPSGPNPIVRPAGPNDTFRVTRRTYAPRYGRLSALRGSAYYGGYYGGYGDAGGYPPFDPTHENSLSNEFHSIVKGVNHSRVGVRNSTAVILLTTFEYRSTRL